MADAPPIGEAQTALQTVRQMRLLLGSEGWTGLRDHLVSEREKLARQILDDDSLTDADREKARIQYKVFRDLLRWPEETLRAQVSVLEASREGSADAEIL